MESLLIVKLSALGDVIHSLAFLYAVKRRWPDLNVDWVVGDAQSSLLQGHPMIRRVMVYRRRELGRYARNPLEWGGVISELSMLRSQVRQEWYDAAVDLQGLFKSGLIISMARAERKIGFAGQRELSHLLLTERLPVYDPDRHAVDRYLDVANYLGAETSRPEFPLGLRPEEILSARNKLSELAGMAPGSYAVLVPGTVWDTKHWTVQGFAEIAKEIHGRYGLKSLVIGSSGQASMAAAIAKGSGGSAISIAGKTALRELAVIFQDCAVCVSVDTGPMHLAVAAGARVVALFGPTAPWRTGPYGTGHKVIRRDLECSPCFSRRCADPVCMTSIGSSEVMQGIESVLGS